MRISQAVKSLDRMWKLKHPVMLWGPPGSAKTSIVKEFCKQRDLQLIIRYLGYYDQTEIRGLPRVVDGMSDYANPKWFPRSGKGVIFLDDFVQAAPSVMNVTSELLLERRIADMELTEGWYVCAAGNPRQYRAGTYEMPSQVRNRLHHITIDPHIDDFRSHGEANRFYPDVIEFLRYCPGLLNKFSATDSAFPTSRTWEIVSDLYNDAGPEGLPRDEELDLVAGEIGELAAVTFIAYRKVKADMVDIDRVIADPDGTPIPGPDKTSAQWAISIALAATVTKKTMTNVVKYVSRLPAEFQSLFMRDIHTRDKSLMETPAFVEWACKNQSFIL